MKNDILIKKARQKSEQNPDSAQAYYELALLLDENGDIDDALTEYEKALQYNIFLHQALFNLGLIYTLKGRFSEAISSWEKIIDSDGNLRIDKINYYNKQDIIKKCIDLWEKYLNTQNTHPFTCSNAGKAFIFLKDYKKAQDAFRELIAKSPNFEMANYYLGFIYSLLGDKKQASDHFKEELKQKPNSIPVISALCASLYKEGKIAESLKNLEHILRTKPNHILANYYLGLIYSMQNNFNDAVSFIKKSADTDPDFAEPHFELAKIFEKQFKMDEAIEEYHLALRIKPDYREANFNLALLYKNLGKAELALKYFQKVTELYPEDDDVRYYTAEVYTQLGKLDEAVKEYKTVISLVPSHGYAHYSLGQVYLRLNKLPEAAESFKKTLNINPKDAFARNLLGVTYFKLNKLTQAIEELQKTIQINPIDMYAYYYLGAVYFKLQDFDKAIKSYEKILELNPSSAHAYFALGAASSRSGDFNNAISQFQKASELIISSDVDLTLFSTLQLLAVIGVEHAQQGQKVGDLYKDLKQSYKDTLKSLVKAVDARDPYTQYHSDRVSKISGYIAREMGLPSEEISKIEIAGYLHDIGKIGIRDEILLKKSALTEDEQEIMRSHPARGYEILKEIHFLDNVTPLVRAHHENIDGSGYPARLKGAEIPLGAKIIGLADYYDAITTDRPYRKAMDTEEAVEEIKKLKGIKFDPAVVDAFLKITDKLPEILKDSKAPI
ncbi:MAG: tetratricopeptide repeat protein [Armatimonadota bacterium]